MGEMKPRVATVWLGGCSGCHMSLLDMDERLIELAARMDLVYGPLLDVKEFPEAVDVTLVEGAVANEENLEQIRTVRARTKLLVAFGDCAVTGNVTALRNVFGDAEPVLSRVYGEAGPGRRPRRADDVVPRLLDRVWPIHQVVEVDLFLPGCPPSADLIHFVLSELLAGRTPDLAGRLRFG
jgi:NAD-reducing hydrogenase small subunit